MAGNVAAQRKYRYGISNTEYQKMLVEQCGKCAACGDGETRLSCNGRVRSLSVDHCHKTKQIRGLLCDDCNNILGRAKDSPSRLRRLAAYIEVSVARLSALDADTALEELCRN